MMDHILEELIYWERSIRTGAHSCGKGAAKAGEYGTVTIIKGWWHTEWLP
jgi:hypothetical protein